MYFILAGFVIVQDTCIRYKAIMVTFKMEIGIHKTRSSLSMLQRL